MSNHYYSYYGYSKFHNYSERINDCAKMNTTELKQATQFLHEKGMRISHTHLMIM